MTLALAVVISTVRAWRAWHDPDLAPDEMPANAVVDAILHALAKVIELTPIALLPAAVLVVIWFWRRR